VWDGSGEILRTCARFGTPVSSIRYADFSEHPF